MSSRENVALLYLGIGSTPLIPQRYAMADTGGWQVGEYY